MSEASTPQGTGLTEAQAAERFEAILAGNGHREGDEPLEEETPQSEAEDEAEEAEDEAAEEGSDDEEDEAPSEQKPDDQSLHTIKVGDEEVTVTLHELKRGFLRESDYTRKTQDLASRAKALEGERAEFAPLAERTKAILEHYEAQLRAPLYDPEEMAQLRYSNPAEWLARSREEEIRSAQVEALLGMKPQLDQALEADKQRQEGFDEADFRAREQDAVTKVVAERPEWAEDPAAGQKAAARINSIGQAMGLTPEEWASVRTDPRMMLLMADAAEMRELRAKKPQVRQRLDEVKAAKPGAATQAPSKITDVTRAKQRLAKTGDVKDAAAVFERMLGK